jgi:exodeoxyribonuclease VII small subunit
MNAKKMNAPNFETAMVELEELVSKIESGNLSLEDSLKEFEKGIKLSQTCQKALTEAEQRVKILTDSLSANESANKDGEADFQAANE